MLRQYGIVLLCFLYYLYSNLHLIKIQTKCQLEGILQTALFLCTKQKIGQRELTTQCKIWSDIRDESTYLWHVRKPSFIAKTRLTFVKRK